MNELMDRTHTRIVSFIVLDVCKLVGAELKLKIEKCSITDLTL